MKLSHSKLSTLISNPLKYKAIYKLGLSLKHKSSALSIGSAVHWGIDNNTSDLQEYFSNLGTFYQASAYTYEQLLAESMVFGYLNNKDILMQNILKDLETGEQLELLDEQHEITLTASLPSKIENNEQHSFLGIIDLLLLTNKGFIIIDYKTSRNTPNYSDYLEQIYRYVFLVKNSFPEVPIYKIGIINLRKASIRQKKTETEFSFLQRLKEEYKYNDENYISHYIYTEDSLDKKLLTQYFNNLSKMADYAEHIEQNKLFWWNYSDEWGKDFYGICHNVADSYLLFNISDTIFNSVENKIVDIRDAKEIDMLAINEENILHKYEQFETQAIAYFSINEDVNKDKLFMLLKQNYKCDDELLEQYWLTLQAKLEGIEINNNEIIDSDEQE